MHCSNSSVTSKAFVISSPSCSLCSGPVVSSHFSITSGISDLRTSAPCSFCLECWPPHFHVAMFPFFKSLIRSHLPEPPYFGVFSFILLLIFLQVKELLMAWTEMRVGRRWLLAWFSGTQYPQCQSFAALLLQWWGVPGIQLVWFSWWFSCWAGYWRTVQRGGSYPRWLAEHDSFDMENK